MGVIKWRMQTQTKKDDIDRFFVVVYPVEAAKNFKTRAPVWFVAHDEAQASSGLIMMRHLCQMAARAGRSKELLSALEECKGQNIHVVHRSVEPKIMRGRT